MTPEQGRSVPENRTDSSTSGEQATPDKTATEDAQEAVK